MTNELKERDAVMRERAAYVRGATCFVGNKDNRKALDETVAAIYPLPIIERPRVVTDSDGYQWRVVNGAVEYRYNAESSRWASDNGRYIRISDLARIASLLANPTELVPDE